MALRKEGDPVPAVEERVAYLEGRAEDQSGVLSEIRTDVRELRSEIRELRGDISGQFQAARSDMNSEFRAMRTQFLALDTKINWVIGSLLATALAVIGALLKH